nr:acetylglutamate kinase [uncultured Agathobaculum sp.]
MDTQLDAELKAKILVEALPYIQKYYGQTVVVKYGGNAMINEELKDAVIHDLVLLNLVGVKIVVVHGGGPEISEMLKKIGKESRFVNGLRYTDRETMDIVQMVLCGKVNKDLVTLLEKAGGRGIGLGGMDGGMFQAKRMTDRTGTDYGYVGDIVDVNPAPVIDVLEKGYIPVVSTVAQGIDDETNYNINADTAACKLAVALGAKKLILLTDVRGLMLDPDDESTLLTNLKVSEVPKLMRDGIIKGGMIPKVDCCVEAVRKGVDQANIQDGRVKHSILIELLSKVGVGTMFQ